MARRDAGKAALEQVLSKIPDAAKREALMKDLGTDDVYDVLGDGFLRQEDYSQRQNELAAHKADIDAKHEEMVKWFNPQKQFLEDYKVIKPKYDELVKKAGKGGEGKDDPPAAGAGQDPAIADALKVIDSLKAEIKDLQEGGPAFVVTMQELSDRFKDDFGKNLDRTAVLKHARKTGANIVQAYEELYKERYEEKAKKEQEDRDKAAEQRGFDRARRELAAGALPIAIADSGDPGTLSGLTGKVAKENVGVAAAVRAFNEGTHRSA